MFEVIKKQWLHYIVKFIFQLFVFKLKKKKKIVQYVVTGFKLSNIDINIC